MPGSGCKGDQLWAPTKVFIRVQAQKRHPMRRKKASHTEKKNHKEKKVSHTEKRAPYMEKIGSPHVFSMGLRAP